MKQLEIKRAFHIESDNMIYRDLTELYPIFRKHFGNKKYNKSSGINYDNFLKNSLKKFVEYNR